MDPITEFVKYIEWNAKHQGEIEELRAENGRLRGLLGDALTEADEHGWGFRWMDDARAALETEK